ncbi:hypothetical protein V6N13_039711 [Hibiscus sabdariffa]
MEASDCLHFFRIAWGRISKLDQGCRLQAEVTRALETAVVAGIAGTIRQRLPHKWEAPPNECLKFNTDGARDVLNGAFSCMESGGTAGYHGSW